VHDALLKTLHCRGGVNRIIRILNAQSWGQFLTRAVGSNLSTQGALAFKG
jgi:hypothetical protein